MQTGGAGIEITTLCLIHDSALPPELSPGMYYWELFCLLFRGAEVSLFLGRHGSTSHESLTILKFKLDFDSQRYNCTENNSQCI